MRGFLPAKLQLKKRCGEAKLSRFMAFSWLFFLKKWLQCWRVVLWNFCQKLYGRGSVYSKLSSSSADDSKMEDRTLSSIEKDVFSRCSTTNAEQVFWQIILYNYISYISCLHQKVLDLRCNKLPTKTQRNTLYSIPIDHFTVLAKSPGLRMEARLPVTLFWYKPPCFCNVNTD